MPEKGAQDSSENLEEEFKEYGRYSASENMGWLAISLTTFVLIMTLFSSFPPTKAREDFATFLDTSSALILGSGVLFGSSWYLMASIHYPRNLRIKTKNPRETFAIIADACTSAGCLVYGIGLIVILYALNMMRSLTVFIVLFLPAWLLFAYYRFRKFETDKQPHHRNSH